MRKYKFAYLELENEIHAVLAKGVDIIENEGSNDVDAIRLVAGNGVLQTHKALLGSDTHRLQAESMHLNMVFSDINISCQNNNIT